MSHRRRRRSRLTPGSSNPTAADVGDRNRCPEGLCSPNLDHPSRRSGFSATRRQRWFLLVSISARGRSVPAPISRSNTLHWTPLGTAKGRLGRESDHPERVLDDRDGDLLRFLVQRENSNCPGHPLVHAAASTVDDRLHGRRCDIGGRQRPRRTAPVLPPPLTAARREYGQPLQPSREPCSERSIPGRAPPSRQGDRQANTIWVNSGTDNTIQAIVVGDYTNPQGEQTNNSANWTGVAVALSPLLKSSLTPLAARRLRGWRRRPYARHDCGTEPREQETSVHLTTAPGNPCRSPNQQSDRLQGDVRNRDRGDRSTRRPAQQPRTSSRSSPRRTATARRLA